MSPAVEIQVTRPERLTARAILGVAFLLRLPYILHYRFNSDEPQHMHVVWGWTHGLIQYRDIFDNHPPVFHLLMAPLLLLAGERPEALFVMRLAMLPLWVAALALTFAVARRLYDSRVALWATVLLAVHFEFFFVSIEFRTDVLWAVAWLAALTVVVRGQLTTLRAFAAGALLGLALGVSQKTILLVGCLGAATGLAFLLAPESRRQVTGRRAVALIAAAGAGLLTVPLLLAVSFGAAGALGPFWYGAVQHNLLLGMGESRSPWRALLLPAGLGLVLFLARPMIRSADLDRVRFLRFVLLLTAVAYYLFVQALWPFVTSQDWLPVDPLLAIFATAGLAAWASRGGSVVLPAAVLVALLATELCVLILKGPIWRDRAAPQISLVRDTLRLTDPGDCVIDAKGETVFRPRASRWVLESVTIERMGRGLIPDTFPEDAAAARCRVAVVEDERFTPRTRAFLDRSYVRVGSLRVAGVMLGEPEGELRPRTFTVGVQATFAVVAESGPVSGRLDGAPYSGPQELAVGPHEFTPAGPTGRLAVIWTQAIARGYSPFGPWREAR